MNIEESRSTCRKCTSIAIIDLKSNVSKHLDFDMLRYHQVSIFSSSSAGCWAFKGHASLSKESKPPPPSIPFDCFPPRSAAQAFEIYWLPPALWALNICHGDDRHHGILSSLVAGTKPYFEIRGPRPSNQSSIIVLLCMRKLGISQESTIRRARC